MMNKISHIICMAFLSSGMVFASSKLTPCPTCPKGYTVSRLEEVLISQQKSKNQAFEKKVPLYTPVQTLSKVTSRKKTPTQLLTNTAEQSKKTFAPDTTPYKTQEDYLAEKKKTLTLFHPPSEGLADIVRRELRWTFHKK